MTAGVDTVATTRTVVMERVGDMVAVTRAMEDGIKDMVGGARVTVHATKAMPHVNVIMGTETVEVSGSHPGAVRPAPGGGLPVRGAGTTHRQRGVARLAHVEGRGMTHGLQSAARPARGGGGGRPARAEGRGTTRRLPGAAHLARRGGRPAHAKGTTRLRLVGRKRGEIEARGAGRYCQPLLLLM